MSAENYLCSLCGQEQIYIPTYQYVRIDDKRHDLCTRCMAETRENFYRSARSPWRECLEHPIRPSPDSEIAWICLDGRDFLLYGEGLQAFRAWWDRNCVPQPITAGSYGATI